MNSYWQYESHQLGDVDTGARRGPVQRELAAQYIVVGGGVAGLTAALLLAQKGKQVLVLETGTVGSGATGHNTGKVTALHGGDLLTVSRGGRARARAFYSQLQAAKEWIAATAVQLEPGLYHRMSDYLYTQQPGQVGRLRQLAALIGALGGDCQLTSAVPAPLPVAAAVVLPGQGQINPRRYCQLLAKEITGLGGQVYEGCRAIGLQRDGAQVLLQVEGGGTARGERVLVCTHYPFWEGDKARFMRLYPYRSYAVAGHCPLEFSGSYIRLEGPTRSLVKVPGTDILVLAGQSHRTGQQGPGYGALQRWGKEQFRMRDVFWQWTAQDYDTADKMPYVGRLDGADGRVLAAFGFSKWGMTGATAAAHLLAEDCLQGGGQYGPLALARPAWRQQGFWRENAATGAAAVKSLFFDCERPGRRGRSDAAAGAARKVRVVKLAGKTYGLYRDAGGAWQGVRLKCTHMGCKLRFDPAEQTWECPCHGSRFTLDGQVLQGVAKRPLEPIDPHILKLYSEKARLL